MGFLYSCLSKTRKKMLVPKIFTAIPLLVFYLPQTLQLYGNHPSPRLSQNTHTQVDMTCTCVYTPAVFGGWHLPSSSSPYTECFIMMTDSSFLTL